MVIKTPGYLLFSPRKAQFHQNQWNCFFGRKGRATASSDCLVYFLGDVRESPVLADVLSGSFATLQFIF